MNNPQKSLLSCNIKILRQQQTTEDYPPQTYFKQLGQDTCNNTKNSQVRDPVTTANSGGSFTGGLFQTAWSRFPQQQYNSTLLMDLSKQPSSESATAANHRESSTADLY
jgi:hypothetical protein